MYHTESSSSESSDEARSEKEKKEWTHPTEDIRQVIDWKSCHVYRSMELYSSHIDMNTPDTHEHDDITRKVDDTGIGKHFSSSIGIRESSEEEPPDEHADRIKCLSVSCPRGIDSESLDNTWKNRNEKRDPENVEKCSNKNEGELRFLDHVSFFKVLGRSAFASQYSHICYFECVRTLLLESFLESIEKFELLGFGSCGESSENLEACGLQSDESEPSEFPDKPHEESYDSSWSSCCCKYFGVLSCEEFLDLAILLIAESESAREVAIPEVLHDRRTIHPPDRKYPYKFISFRN